MKKTFFLPMLLCGFCACSSDDDDNNSKDMTYPEISDTGIVANPIPCQQYACGDTIAFNYLFTDNQELGSYNIEIHNNFDHHTHDTSDVVCSMDEKKNAGENAWVFNQAYNIPAGLRSYNARIDIAIPKEIRKKLKDPKTGLMKDSLMPLEPGDYHFAIRVTDHAGWQQLKAVAIKIIE